MIKKNNTTKTFLQNDDPEYIEFQQRRARLNDLIRDVYSGTSSNLNFEDMKLLYQNMLDSLANRNPYFKQGIVLVTPSIELDYEKDGETLGDYDSKINLMRISYHLLYETLTTKKAPLAKLFYVIGHESAHKRQKDTLMSTIPNENSILKGLNDDQRERAQNLIDDFQSLKLDEYSVMALTSILEHRFGKNIDGFTGQDQQRKQEMCKQLAFDLYFKAEHEKDAREKGYDFANFMIDRLCEDESIEKHIRDDLANQKKILKQEQMKDDYYYNEENPLHSSFEKAVEDAIGEMTADQFDEIIHELMSQVYSVKWNKDIDRSVIREFRSKIISAVQYLNFIICKDKPSEAIMDYVLDSCAAGYDENIPHLLKALDQKIDFTKEKKKELKVNVADLLISGDVPLDAFGADYSQLYNQKEQSAIFSCLLSSDQVMKASKLYSASFFLKNFSVNSKEDAFSKEIIKRLQQYVKDCKASGKICYREWINSQRIKWDFSREENKKAIEELHAEVESLIENKVIEPMSKSESHAYLKEKYGETFAEDLAKKYERYSFRFDEAVRKAKENQKKRQEEMISSGRLISEPQPENE